jgi:hypothetical protein
VTDVSRELGRLWAELAPGEKAEYEKKAKIAKDRYEKVRL